jgi:lysophospholipase L1-like esterase
MPATSRHGRARAVLFRALPSLLLMVLLLAIEGAVRLLLPPLPALDTLVAAPDQLLQLVGRQDTDARRQRPRLFEADPLLFWRLRPNVPPLVWNQTLVSTNELGLRHPGPIGRKRPGTFRVVCLGDSVTFGFRVPLATADDPTHAQPGEPYPRLLEEALRRPGRAVDVVAMAVPGYSSHQGLAWARRDLAALAPDLVIVSFGWNDVSLMPRADVEAMPADVAHVAARSVLIHSQAALRLVHTRHGRPSAPAASATPLPLVPRVSQEAYVANMRAIVAAARGGAKVLVLGPVYRDALTVPDEARRMHDYREALATAMAADGVAYLAVRELTEDGAPENDALFVEHIHPNSAGHARLAAALAAEIEARGLVPR